MIIRRGVQTDIFELSRLWSYMVYEQDETLTPNLDMWRNYILGMMNYNGYFMFVAEHDNMLIGFIDYAMQPDPGKNMWVAMINSFYVLPENRDSDVSGRLWRTMIKNAKKGCAKEFSSCCFPEKLEFWKRHGFKEQCLTIRRKL